MYTYSKHHRLAHKQSVDVELFAYKINHFKKFLFRGGLREESTERAAIKDTTMKRDRPNAIAT